MFGEVVLKSHAGILATPGYEHPRAQWPRPESMKTAAKRASPPPNKSRRNGRIPCVRELLVDGLSAAMAARAEPDHAEGPAHIITPYTSDQVWKARTESEAPDPVKTSALLCPPPDACGVTARTRKAHS